MRIFIDNFSSIDFSYIDDGLLDQLNIKIHEKLVFWEN